MRNLKTKKKEQLINDLENQTKKLKIKRQESESSSGTDSASSSNSNQSSDSDSTESEVKHGAFNEKVNKLKNKNTRGDSLEASCL